MKKYEYSPIVISGPSGAGKTTIINKLILRNQYIKEAVGYTTRKKRIGEEDGKEYYFINKKSFLEMVKKNKFIEYTNFNGEYYGMPISELKKSNKEIKIFNVGVDSAIQIKKLREDAVTIYLIPPDKHELLKRMGKREYSRYLIAKKEVSKVLQTFDFLLINKTNEEEKVTENLEKIIFFEEDKFEFLMDFKFIMNFY